MSLLVLFDPRLKAGVASRKKLHTTPTTNIEKWRMDVSLSGFGKNHVQNIAYDKNMSVQVKSLGKKHKEIQKEEEIEVIVKDIKVRYEDE